MSRFNNWLVSRKLPLIVTILYTALVLAVLLHRFWQYEVFYYDHGYTESAAYQVSQFKMPLWDREGKSYAFIDHFYPSLTLLLAPFYWIWNAYEMPVVFISILIGSTVLLGYEIGLTLKINKIMLWALLFAYMFYIGFQNAQIFFLKDITASMPFLMLLFLSVIKKWTKAFYALLLVNLGFKETIAITGMALGIYIFLFGEKLRLFEKAWRIHGIAAFLISLSYGILISKFVIPYFIYKSFGHYGRYGFTPDLELNPFYYLYSFVDNAQKRETILTSLATFGFLPILSPMGIIMTLQDFAQRFVLSGATPLRIGLNLHYNASLAVILLVGSIVSIAKLSKYKIYKKFLILHAIFIIIIVAFFHQFVYHGPLGLIYNKDFFKITKNLQFIDDFVDKIPREGKIMVQNNLAVRFTHDDYYILASEEYLQKVDPDVVILDFRPGQNINNYWPMTEEKMAALATALLAQEKYQAIYRENHRYIFTKKAI